MALKAPNNKYVNAKKLGGLSASKPAAGPEELFVLHLLNRPRVVLKTSNMSFVGLNNTGKVVGNKATGEVFEMGMVGPGIYALRSSSTGRFVSLQDDSSLLANAGEPGPREQFYVELYLHSKLALKAVSNGKYIKAENHGAVSAISDQQGDMEVCWT